MLALVPLTGKDIKYRQWNFCTTQTSPPTLHAKPIKLASLEKRSQRQGRTQELVGARGENDAQKSSSDCQWRPRFSHATRNDSNSDSWMHKSQSNHNRLCWEARQGLHCIQKAQGFQRDTSTKAIYQIHKLHSKYVYNQLAVNF